MTRRIIIFGGSGFLGRALSDKLGQRSVEVVVVSRTPVPVRPGLRHVSWDGATLGEWVEELSGAHAVVHLCGKRVDCAPTDENLRELIDSRVKTVRLVGDAMARVEAPPRVWIQAGSLAVYGECGDDIVDEDTQPSGVGPAQQVQVCLAWEQAYRDATATIDRRVLLRMGVSIGGVGDPVMDQLTRLAQFGLGGSVAGGQQWISWIALEDLVAVMVRGIDDPQMAGTYNVTAPNPVTNRDMMAQVRRLAGRRFGIPSPAPMVKLGARMLSVDPGLVFVSRRCVPKRLLDEGFVFRTPDFAEAAAQARGKKATADRRGEGGLEQVDRSHE